MGLPHAEKRNNAQESISIDRRSLLLGGTTLAAAAAVNGPVGSAKAQEQPAAGTGKPPNILVIFGDDIGIPQNSAYTMGPMGYRTPNIDRIAAEGSIFTDAYGQQSCTAGRILHSRPGTVPHGAADDRHARRPARHTGLDAHHRRRREVQGLCDRPVRQESPGRA
ncbi:sulfatase-like hydrolase/transferase [Sinorhizobium meliloti]|jgi:hypothetical protein|uniref:sulfatase-like hydrolase/transferase n=1 Tax=Rhizobium meliloti TaxID=382 RepID=UPI000D1A3310|nr:sulfatase-like hydrolase/transferase [Sinorhizobium meliloti]RVL42939.1 hypothetical protein CN146_20395 [Sinorhizobium meliloti]RVN18328.1 hypothetical protein CN114_25725 [Sinorhizobium meliloti]RVN21271.1 hypothetical protein CN115_02230 [Sinorhizobium meliloti]RVO15280.1 hypothetical protein CN099_05950 [Sinorhizobium meliloti]